MPISRALSERITQDARSPDYWFVPKGQAVNEENWPRIAEHLRLLEKFKTIPWNQAQPSFAKALLREKLIEPYRQKHESGFSAVARMQLPVWRLLGLAWINQRGVPEVTEIGRDFVKARSSDERRRLLTAQLHRYQFSNPSLAGHFRGFRTFPILALYRLLSHVGWRLSWVEFRLFGTRIRNFQDADAIGLLVEEWRGLEHDERDKLLAIAQTVRAESHTKSKEGTTLRKIDDGLNYLLALRILPDLRQDSEGLGISAATRRQLHRLVLSSAESAEFIDYEAEQDWLALYGQAIPTARVTQPWTTATEARAYYERIGRIDAAADAYAREDRDRKRSEVERYRSVQILERVLEDILAENLEQLEDGLKLEGRQYRTAVGPIDLLARDASGMYVVIELKRGRTGDRVVGQIARYITWVVQRLAAGKPARVRGIIVGRDFDHRFAAAVEQLGRVSSYTFDLQIMFERWPLATGGSTSRRARSQGKQRRTATARTAVRRQARSG